MSVSMWAYIPEKCDGDFCPMDCDFCSKRYEYEKEGDADYVSIYQKLYAELGGTGRED